MSFIYVWNNGELGKLVREKSQFNYVPLGEQPLATKIRIVSYHVPNNLNDIWDRLQEHEEIPVIVSSELKPDIQYSMEDTLNNFQIGMIRTNSDDFAHIHCTNYSPIIQPSLLYHGTKPLDHKPAAQQ